MKQNEHIIPGTALGTVSADIRPTVLLSSIGILPLTLILNLLLLLSLIILG